MARLSLTPNRISRPQGATLTDQPGLYPTSPSPRRKSGSTTTDDSARRRQPSRAVKLSSLYPIMPSARGGMVKMEPSDNPYYRVGSPFASTGMSPSSTSQGSDEVRYTKTGRISKALKGRRVHECEICGKSYTRAEHLRRHRLNHEGQTLQCNIAGCDRSFKRTDLLLRHREEHKIERQRSPSEMGMLYPHSQMDSSYGRTEHSPYPSSHGGSLPTKPYFETGAQFSPVPFQVPEAPYVPELGVTGPDWNAMSIQSSPSLFSTPGPEQQGDILHPQPFPAASASAYPLEDHGQLGFESCGSQTPASVSSSFLPTWNQLEHQLRMHRAITPFSTGSYTTATTANGSSYNHNTNHNTTNNNNPDQFLQTMVVDPTNVFSALTPFNELDYAEGARIMQDLAEISGMPPDVDQLSQFTPLQDIYLSSYWRNFHPLFPVIHQPSFCVEQIPPLLKALMIAIGASYHDDYAAKSTAKSLRDTCSKLLEKRPIIPYSQSRIWDLLAVFLAEAFGLYRSRRPSVQFSMHFQSMFGSLQNDVRVFSSRTLEELVALPFDLEEEVAEQYRVQWINDESKRRLYLASHILEVQQATFFNSQTHLPTRDLPSPSTSRLWEALSLFEWLDLARQELDNPSQISDILGGYYPPRKDATYNAFESSIITSMIATTQDYLMVAQENDYFDGIDNAPRSLFTFHSAGLACHVPVHELLAVCGETFVLGDKLPTHDQFKQAKIDLETWLWTDDAKQALQHATKILRISYQHSRLHLLHEEWTLYLAALVCWTHGIWVQRGQRQVVAALRDPVFVEKDMAQLMARIEDPSAPFSPSQNVQGIRACLRWVRERIAGQIGGVVEDAVTVLDKLGEGSRVAHA